MKIFLTKASDDYWYKIIECDSIDEMFRICRRKFIVKKNYYDYDDLEFWEGMKETDKIKVVECKYNIIIYDSYVE